ncbi:hypothetical protein [Olivibacter domesticus]|uniref:Uncharacterized protein n=1 Tax=Olivibacter domesticus TaxID=407022 RepID=A0A1H7KZS0_OLID1|nr:hypothetical protein [Olivibacter domesticus]SEK91497.1 hypothetical protein SAMN05661044_01495 [Olivibacter domesticus]
MPRNRIKIKTGFTYLEFEELNDDSSENVHFILRMSKKNGDQLVCHDAKLSLHHIKQMHQFTTNIMAERQEELTSRERLVFQRNSQLRNLYIEAEKQGFFSKETIDQLTALGIPVTSLLAAELKMTVDDLKDYLCRNSLPFIFFEKIYAKGKEMIVLNQ